MPRYKKYRGNRSYSELTDFGLNITVYDPWANPDEVNNEYGIKIMNELSKFKFEAIILAVAHNEFKELDIENLKK